jgi:hypothetical protein
MPSVTLPQAPRPFAATSRRDRWWVVPVLTFLGLLAFVVYTTWAALQGNHYSFGPYLSPMYSPLFQPSWFPWSPALLILWAPAGFRFTCYYYRGAYYKAFWADPPSCAVGEPRKHFLGENSFPLILQNVHRYFFYLAVVFLFILAYDAWCALWFVDPQTGQKHFGIGVGTLVLILNVVLLSGYTLGCHSLRHLSGGRFDCISQHGARQKAYRCVSCFNRAHMRWAWFSLFWVGFADLYVRLCSMGIWMDWRII